MDSPNRADFLAGLQPGGKYDGVVGLYRHNSSAERIGLFDKQIIQALSKSVKWVAHNGAGYDQIDVETCKEKGRSVVSLSLFTQAVLCVRINSFYVSLLMLRHLCIQHSRCSRRRNSHDGTIPSHLRASPLLKGRARYPCRGMEELAFFGDSA